MLPGLMPLRSWLRRSTSAREPRVHRLLPAADIVERYRRGGADERAAIDGTLTQIRGLREEIESEKRWKALVELARRIGDPWNADDWPLGFDPLLLCVPLCTNVDYECARCPIGQRQDDQSCTHPTSHFGRLGDLVRRADHPALLAALDSLEQTLVRIRG